METEVALLKKARFHLLGVCPLPDSRDERSVEAGRKHKHLCPAALLIGPLLQALIYLNAEGVCVCVFVCVCVCVCVTGRERVCVSMFVGMWVWMMVGVFV